jgi:hypothetical protein
MHLRQDAAFTCQHFIYAATPFTPHLRRICLIYCIYIATAKMHFIAQVNLLPRRTDDAG